MHFADVFARALYDGRGRRNCNLSHRRGHHGSSTTETEGREEGRYRFILNQTFGIRPGDTKILESHRWTVLNVVRLFVVRSRPGQS